MNPRIRISGHSARAQKQSKVRERKPRSLDILAIRADVCFSLKLSGYLGE
jgi:hypothetical protein